MLSRTRTLLAALSTVVSLLALHGVAYADAFYLQAQSARGAGRAFSGEGADTGAPSLWWNPASIGGILEGDAVLSAAAIIPRGLVVDTGTAIRRPSQSFAPIGGDAVSRNPIDKGILPSGAVAYPLTDRIAIGLAVTSPFSFTTDYDATSWARYSADRTRLRTIDIQPSIGVAVTDWLRVGGAVNVEYTDATLSNALPNVLASLPDGRQELAGDGWDFGWSAGVQMHNDTVTVGVSYKSAIKHNLKGDLTISGLVGPLAGSNRTVADATANFTTPSQVIVAGRARATEQLTLNAQLVASGWSRFDAIRLGAPLNTAIPEEYKDSWSLAGGADYAATRKLTVRGGVQRTFTPTQDGRRDARVPDANRWTYAAGGSYQLTSRFSVDAAAQYVDFANAPIDRITAAYAGTAAQTPILTSGELRDASAIVVSLGGRLRF